VRDDSRKAVLRRIITGGDGFDDLAVEHYASAAHGEPIDWLDEVDAWVCTSRSVADTVLKDGTRYGLVPWSDEVAAGDPGTVLLRRNWLEFTVGQAHRDARRRLSAAIARSLSTTAWEAVARELDELTSDVAGAAGPVDLVDACAEPLWHLLLSVWFGFDPDLVARVRDALGAVSALVVGQADDEATRAATELLTTVSQAVAVARSTPDTARGLLLALTVEDGERAPDRVVAANLLNLASDTSPLPSAALLCAHGLLTDPTARRQLPDHSEHAGPGADKDPLRQRVEELMRRDPVQVWTLRFAQCDHVLAGHRIRRDDRILVVLGAANHDAGRSAAVEPHEHSSGLAFGLGPHSCVGRRFAVAVVTRFVRGLLGGSRLSLAAPATWAKDVGIRRLTELVVTRTTAKG
jgi:cytochrome P450